LNNLIKLLIKNNIYFLDQSLNDNRTLPIVKGNIGSVFSRKFVDFIIDEINPDIFLKRLSTVRYGGDEMFFQTLNANDDIGLSRYFKCVGKADGYIPCKSRRFRHGICLLNYLNIPELLGSKFLFCNKMIPDIDYTSIVCLAKYLFNRSFIKRPLINRENYLTMTNVIYNSNRSYWKKHPEKFSCYYKKNL
uniref:RNA-dependent RNA polymerase n=1 Tax=Syphacia muris TaxID=451379 RepID=A0A0N5AAM8_9BILA